MVLCQYEKFQKPTKLAYGNRSEISGYCRVVGKSDDLKGP